MRPGDAPALPAIDVKLRRRLIPGGLVVEADALSPDGLTVLARTRCQLSFSVEADLRSEHGAQAIRRVEHDVAAVSERRALLRLGVRPQIVFTIS
jgi:hypothetical protein